MMTIAIESLAPEKCSSNEAAAPRLSASRRQKSEFPTKLYAILELADTVPEFSQAVTWLPHGRAFRVLDKDTFMKEVVPLFFNQTKIRSFNRQLHLWGFRRIGRGNEQVWYNDNFLRGAPESMERLVRTKIKGTMTVSSEHLSVPNFDDLPPLPVCYKQPSDVLDEIRRAVLKMNSSSIQHRDDSIMPPNLLHASVNDVTNHRTVLPGSESPCPWEFSLSVDQKQPIVLPRSNDNQSDSQSVPSTRFDLPVRADNSKSMTYTNQSTFEGTAYQDQSQQLRSFSYERMGPLRLSHVNEDFEPLPWFGNDFCLSDDFANFIEGAIQSVEG